MLKLRKSESRGTSRFSWLHSRHSFSFGEYYDPAHMSFGSLRVINDDRVVGGAGFPEHPHRNMEILTYVVEGAVAHGDSMGNKKRIEAGQLQTMSAGSGITHSEYNPLKDQETRFLQIWITPRKQDLTPSYAEWQPDTMNEKPGLSLMASPDGRDGSVVIHQEVEVYLLKGGSATLALTPGTKQWLQVISGDVRVNGEMLSEGDALAIESEPTLELSAQADAQALLFNIGN
jgi:hypothetical protein